MNGSQFEDSPRRVFPEDGSCRVWHSVHY